MIDISTVANDTWDKSKEKYVMTYKNSFIEKKRNEKNWHVFRNVQLKRAINTINNMHKIANGWNCNENIAV